MESRHYISIGAIVLKKRAPKKNRKSNQMPAKMDAGIDEHSMKMGAKFGDNWRKLEENSICRQKLYPGPVLGATFSVLGAGGPSIFASFSFKNPTNPPKEMQMVPKNWKKWL